MRRLSLLLAAIGAFFLATAAIHAQSGPPDPAGATATPVALESPEDLLVPRVRVDELEEAPAQPRGPSAAAAGDSCVGATELALSFSLPADGGATLINPFTEEVADPNLSCTWGTPTRPQGYRTAWYKYVATDTGQVTITTRGSDYDTILAVYTGQCESLLQIACSDDYIGLQSEVDFQAIRNQTYYIEVADYQVGIDRPTILAFSAIMDGLPSRWQRRTNWNLPLGGISRHMAAPYDRYIFIIGGQTQIQGIPTISNAVQRFDAFDQRWQIMSPIPGPGLSNTTAVQLNGRIYIPGGFDGNLTAYSGTHWEYIINADEWRKQPSIPAGLLPGGRTFAWAASAAEPSGGAYYVSGGITSMVPLAPDAQVISTTYRYTPATKQWQGLPPMTTERYAHTGAWVSRFSRGFCVAGGLATDTDLGGRPLSVLLTNGECYNPYGGAGWVPTGPLNFPRYGADSAVGPDGNWYIFGGADATGAVAETEVYDPATNTWILLDSSYSLGGRPNYPARVWPQGEFIGNNLWIFGGNDFPERRVLSDYWFIPLTGSQVALPNRVLVPFTSYAAGANFLNDASPIGVGGTATGNFRVSTQFFNPYFTDIFEYGRYTFLLSNIPSDSNFNIWVYNSRKVFLGRGDPAQYGGQKAVSLTLEPGRYYIIIERLFPKDIPDPADYYNLTVLREPGR